MARDQGRIQVTETNCGGPVTCESSPGWYGASQWKVCGAGAGKKGKYWSPVGIFVLKTREPVLILIVRNQLIDFRDESRGGGGCGAWGVIIKDL